MLPKKRHATTDADVANAMERIEMLVTLPALEERAETVIAHLQKTMAGHKTAFAWSGGKDSVVLAHLMQRAGVPLTGMCGLTRGLEYPAMDAWYARNTPEEIEIVRSPEDILWLRRHPQYLFAFSPVDGYWSNHVWLTPQNRYCEQHGSDMLILGRRRADGNYCGPGTSGIYAVKGVTRYLPIVDWTQEEVLAYLHYYKLGLPPVYGWVNGFKVGGHPWPARPSIVDEEDGWAQTYQCDPYLVIRMAEYFDGARRYLEHPTPGKGYGKNVWSGHIYGE